MIPNLLNKVTHLIEIGISLSSERDIHKLLEKILFSAKLLTHSDGGTLYTVTADQKLHFEISVSDSLRFRLGGTSGQKAILADIPLFLPDGSFNEGTIVSHAATKRKVVNIEDAYYAAGFD